MLEKSHITTDSFTILIADRNPRVRDFLQRELIAEGYQTKIAKDGREVVEMAQGDDSCELLILDLDMPHMSGPGILETIQRLRPSLPVIIHTFATEYEKHPAVQRAARFWEKRGNNIDGFKTMVMEVLKTSYPNRFWSGSGQGVQQIVRRRNSTQRETEAVREGG
jgi:CheY-like chemotaxis protein